MALSDRVTSITQEKYVPVSIDAILNSNVLTQRTFMMANKQWGGRQLQIPLQFARPTSGGSFSGVGNFDTALQNTRTRQTFSHAKYYQNVSLAGDEVSLNKSDAEVLDLTKISLEEGANSMLDGIGTQLYGLGTGDDILGLGAIVDDGTNTSTYAGLTRTTYPQVNSTVTAFGSGTLSFTNMATVFRGVAAAGTGKQRPTVIVTTETVMDLMESLFTPTIQSTYSELSRGKQVAFGRPGESVDSQTALNGNYGFVGLAWRGIPVLADEKCTSGYMYFLNENYLNWYNLKDQTGEFSSYQVTRQVDGVYSEMGKTYPIQWSGFQKPFNQYGQIGQFLLMGNLISGQTRRQGVGTGITTV